MNEMDSAVQTAKPITECYFFSNYLIFDPPTRFFHLASTILLAVTAIFHSYIAIDSQNVGAQQCIFHLTLTLCVIHMEIFFCFDKSDSFSFNLNYMIIIFGLASFIWSAMLAHQLWKNFGKYGSSDEKSAFQSRLLLGYGIPGLFLISALGPWSSDQQSKNMFCRSIVPLALLFAILIQTVNIYFFIDLLRKAVIRIVWYSHDTSMKLMDIIYRTVIFVMLFDILALPWLTIMGCKLFSYATKSGEPIEILPYVIRFLSAEGIFLSFALIIYHKYAWKSSIIQEEKSWNDIPYESIPSWKNSVA